MAPSDLRNRKMFATSIENEIYKAFRELSIEEGIFMSRLLDEALKDFLEKKRKEAEKEG